MLRYDLAGLQLAMALDNEEIFSWSGGLAQIDKRIPVTDQTVFRIASPSKMVTTLAVLLLVKDGKLDLDADISTFTGFPLRNPHVLYEPVTMRQLLTHTSGLTDGLNYDRFVVESLRRPESVKLQDFMETEEATHWLPQVPGSFFTYSNLGFVVAGTIVERISGERFDRFIRKNILSPLSVTGSTNLSDFVSPERIGTLYRKTGGRWIAQTDDFKDGFPDDRRFDNYVPGTNALPFGPQGGLRISARGMLKILQLIKNGGSSGAQQFLPKDLIAEMKTAQWTRNGFNGGDGEKYGGQFAVWGLGTHLAGWQASDDFIPGAKWFGHPGEAYGLLSGAYCDGKRSFVFIMNGVGVPLKNGPRTGYYEPEEAVYNAISDVFSAFNTKTSADDLA